MYKIEAPEGAPEWYQPWIVCRVRDSENHAWYSPRPVVWIPYHRSTYPWEDNCKLIWAFAEPVEAWKPEEGEMVALKWMEDGSKLLITPFIKDYIGPVARLVYPDNRVVDVSKGWDWLVEHTDTLEG